MSESYVPKAPLFAGDYPKETKLLTLVLGAGALEVGTVLGKITKGAITKAVAGAGEANANTGDGTLTLDVTTPILAGAKPGVYKVRILRIARAQVGTTPAVPAFLAVGELRDPDGNVLEVFDILGSGGTTVANQVKFAMAEGSTPFALTDGFDITIAAGSGSFKIVNSANIDGSEAPYAVLAEDADATSAAKVVTAYLIGSFNQARLVFGGSDTFAKHEIALRKLGIFGKPVIA